MRYSHTSTARGRYDAALVRRRAGLDGQAQDDVAAGRGHVDGADLVGWQRGAAGESRGGVLRQRPGADLVDLPGAVHHLEAVHAALRVSGEAVVTAVDGDLAAPRHGGDRGGRA